MMDSFRQITESQKCNSNEINESSQTPTYSTGMTMQTPSTHEGWEEAGMGLKLIFSQKMHWATKKPEAGSTGQTQVARNTSKHLAENM